VEHWGRSSCGSMQLNAVRWLWIERGGIPLAT
jgi:hypothetical protein